MSIRQYLQQRRASFVYAFRGIRITWATQAHAKLHLAAALLATLAAWRLELSSLEWALVLLAIGMVWVSETLNTAIEFTVDLASPAQHPLAAKAKDAAAGAVLLAAFFAVAIGALVFLPRLLDLFS